MEEIPYLLQRRSFRASPGETGSPFGVSQSEIRWWREEALSLRVFVPRFNRPPLSFEGGRFRLFVTSIHFFLSRQ